MGWFKFRRTSPGPVVAPSPSSAPKPESALEAFARWRRYWAEAREREARVYAEQLRREEVERADRAARAQDLLMSSMAANGGSHFPGDLPTLFRDAPQGGMGLLTFEQWRRSNLVDIYERDEER